MKDLIPYYSDNENQIRCTKDVCGVWNMSDAKNCINCNNPLKSKEPKNSEKSRRLRRRPIDGPDLIPSTSAACFNVEESLNLSQKTKHKKSETFSAELKTSMTEVESRPSSKSKSLGGETKPKAPVRRGSKSLDFDAKIFAKSPIQIFGQLDAKNPENEFLKDLKMFRVETKRLPETSKRAPKGLYFIFGRVIGLICLRKLGKTIKHTKLKQLSAQFSSIDNSNKVPLLISQSYKTLRSRTIFIN